jgi:four helix bundle protein
VGRLKGDLRDRTYNFGLEILDLVDQLPNNPKGWQLCKQIVRSGTSIGANIEEADQALTVPDFVHKCSIARKEANETLYWLRICRDKRMMKGESLDGTIKTADEFVRIISTIMKKCIDAE